MLKLVTPDGEETTLSTLLQENFLGEWKKFVVIQKGGIHYMCLFDRETYHVDIANSLLRKTKDATFVAGGMWTRMNDTVMLNYSSDTCCTEYGYDRPKDPTEAAKLLSEIETLLLSE